MIQLLIAAALANAPATVVLNQTIPATVPKSECDVDRPAMMQLSHHDFDQNFAKGWRLLASKPECRIAAADLIREYRKANWSKLKPHELHINYWHEGQLRAAANQTEAAIPLLLAGVGTDTIGGFEHYAMATVAFLQRDLPGLEAARARLAAIPVPPRWYEEHAKDAPTAPIMKWPPNLDVVDGLIKCFTKPYSEAYGPECRPADE